MKNTILFVVLLAFCLFWISFEQSTKELVDFDINVISIKNDMPYDGENPHENEAYVIIGVKGMDEDFYNSKYEINQIVLNGNNIAVSSIQEDVVSPDEGDFCLGRFYSSHYKNNNKMTIVFKNKVLNELYKKDVSFSTKTVF